MVFRFCLFNWILLLVDHSGQAGSKSAEEGDTSHSPREASWCQAYPKENTLPGYRGAYGLYPWNLYASILHGLLCVYFCVLFYVLSAAEHSAGCVPLDDEWREEDSICPNSSILHPFLFGGGRERQKLWQNRNHLHEGNLRLTCFKNGKLQSIPLQN